MNLCQTHICPTNLKKKTEKPEFLSLSLSLLSLSGSFTEIEMRNSLLDLWI